jgi:NTE family protein
MSLVTSAMDFPRPILASFATGALLVAGLALGAAGAEAEEAAQSAPGPCTLTAADRPSVGLALSGGGARGGAHIGVLKALDELRVPIDCIAGTSVGAVIGGFYASGLSVGEIETIARGIDFNTAFSNAIPRVKRSFRRKQEDYLFLADLPPGLRAGRLAFPIGLVQGQVIDMILSRAIAETYAVRDFDHLGMPFRAVATDIATGSPVVLGSGDLARALRASMSLPAVLAPIDIDGRMLVDGGLAMNLPIEVVQAMGADIVVAVDVTSSLLARESMRSVLDVTSQITTLITQPSMQQQKKLLDADDVLLVPAFDAGATFTSFAQFGDTIGDGYRAVMGERRRFGAWSLDAERYAAHVAERGHPRPVQRPIVSFVRLDNRSSIADSVILARIGDVALGAPLDLPAVEAAVARVYGLEMFQNVRYEVVTDAAGAAGLQIQVDERAWGPSYFQVGLHYASSSSADSIFALDASYLRTGVNSLGGEWRAMMSLGDEPSMVADFYQPLGPRAEFFVESQLVGTSSVLNVFADGIVATSFDMRDAALEIAAGRVFRSAAEMRVGVRAASGDYRLRIGDPALLPGDEFRRGEVFARFSADSLDSVAFPRAGSSATIEWRSSSTGRFSAEADFEQVLLAAMAARTWKRHTLLGTFRYDATVSGTAPLHSQFRVGGFRDLSGLTRNELSGQNAARVGLSYFSQIGHFARFPAFAGISLERGNVWDDRHAVSFDDAIAAGSLWAGIATPIGPVYLATGRTDDGRSAVYFSLGGAF